MMDSCGSCCSCAITACSAAAHLLLADDALCGVQDCCSSFVVVCKSALRLNKSAGGYADMFMCA